MTNFNDLSVEQLRQAANIKEQIVALEQQLRGLLAEESVATPKVAKGGLTEAGRARLSAMAKARWAKVKSSKGNGAKPANSGKRTMSAAAKAKISAAAKARWAKVNAAKGK